MALKNVTCKEIQRIQFAVLSPETILNQSVVLISKDDCSTNGVLASDGLMDPRMGPIDNKTLCHTCHQNQKLCPGHYGHIEFSRPLFNIGYMIHVIKVLRKVCYNCSLLLINRDNEEYVKHMREGFTSVSCCQKILLECHSKKKRCQVSRFTSDGKVETIGCGRIQPKYHLCHGWNINVIFPSPQEQTAFEGNVAKASDVASIFSKISDEDMLCLGFHPQLNRPEWMIMTCMLVPPPCMRPNTTFVVPKKEAGDDIGYKLSEIVKHHNRVKKLIENKKPKSEIDSHMDLLQYHVATYMDNKISGVPASVQRMGHPTKGIRQRLHKKEGRFRRNLCGKRGDQAGRSVISPDPNLLLNEVGVPMAIASHLTKSERVFDLNMHDMQQTVWRGPHVKDGANFVVYPSEIARGERTINLSHVDPRSIIIEPGCIVKRHLRDGDYVLFNRQPSLHKTSIMSHRVRVMPCKTFRLNLSATTPYNADFVC